MHQKQIESAGKKLQDAKRALIFLHGRGATAQDILSLREHLNVEDYACLAPQATNFTWYPYSFLAPPAQNEPWLTSALTLLGEVVNDIKEAGIPPAEIYFVGFSQGACLTMEFVARNAQRWGGVAAFTGGLIGDKIYQENYNGNFKGTPFFIGSSDPDPHVPIARVHQSAAIISDRGGAVTEKIIANLGHTISEEEIRLANQLIFKP